MLRGTSPCTLRRKGEPFDLSRGQEVGCRVGGGNGWLERQSAAPGCLSLLSLPPYLIFCHFQRQEKGDLGLDP